MSEKLKNGWRSNIEEEARLCIAFIPVIFLGFAIVIIGVVVRGVIVSVFWNMNMTYIFGFKEITVFQAIVLVCTIACLRFNYLDRAESDYAVIKKECFNETKKEEIAKDVAAILIIAFELISILITAGLIMYFWNNILPQLLNVKLVEINFIQSMLFYCLFNGLCEIPKFNYKNSKGDKKNK